MSAYYLTTFGILGLVAAFGDWPLRPLTRRNHPITRVVGSIGLALLISSLVGWLWFGVEQDGQFAEMVVVYWIVRAVKLSFFPQSPSEVGSR